MRHRHLLPAVIASAAIVVGACLALAPPAAAGPAPASTTAPALPSVYPVPQSIHAQGGAVPLVPRVALVTGPDSDPAAVTAARNVLHDAGAQVDEVSDLAQAAPDESAVFVGGPDENPASRTVLDALGVADASGLAAEGYVLADGSYQDRPVVVLDGHDGTGTFYAVQTMRQLIEQRGAAAQLPGVRVRDWPAQSKRGVIEGFYGTPWSNDQRMRQFDFYGAHKMNTYVYSPKNDPYLRDRWRDQYPPDQLAQIKQLVDRASANHVEFTYALSPGLSICYSSAADEQALVDKFQSLWDIGVRTFSIPLDDISYTKWNCSADQTKWGTGGGAAGAAQSYLLNEVQRDFIDTHAGASRLEMVPTEYSNVSPSPYKTAIKNDLDPAVVVGWTGVGVIATTITRAQAAAAKDVFGHDILLWDNYPVNDYVTDRLLLGPYVGREAGLPLYGITANPMIEPEASKIALFNVADYSWNDTAYDPTSSWQAGLTELAGGDSQARTALAAFADLEYTSRLDPTQAPVLAAKIARFWPAWESGSATAADGLDAYLRIIQSLPATLSARMNDPEFVSESQPWLDSAAAWGQAARAALQMLVDERAGNGAAAIADRQRAEQFAAKAKTYIYDGLGGSVHVTVGDGVIDRFVTDALAENDRWLGVAGRHVTAQTSLSPYQSYVPANMVDGDDSTFFWSNSPPSPGDYVGVDLGTVQPISHVSLHMSKSSSPNDYIHGGNLEYSADGSTWTSLGTYVNTPDIEADAPAGAQARYVRLRDTGSQSYWVVVREFTVTGAQNQSPTVTGTPAPAAGSTLAAAADGNVDTSYVAGSSPADGDALTVSLPKARPLDRVVVVGTGNAAVQIGSAATWRTIGQLDPSGYTELPAGGANAGAIRLAWTAGSPPPSIAEVVPWYADLDSAGLGVLPSSADTSVGDPVDLTATVTAVRAGTETGALSVGTPSGVTAAPARTQLTVYRGSQQSVAVTMSASVAGSYTVPVTFTVPGADPVEKDVTLVVHPAVGSTNVAAAAQGATASASSTEDGLPRFTPDHAIDGDLSTRWSSDHSDDQWLQVQFAAPQHLGKLVLHWETAHAKTYEIETSSDGTNWTTATTVTNSQGGTETVWIDESDVSYLRMQGVTRSTQYGYSIYELEAYPIV